MVEENVRLYDAFSKAKAIREEGNLTIIRYDLITRDKLLKLKKYNALVLITISPLEVHGGFLPLGTDFLEAIMMFEWVKDFLKQREEKYTLIEIPPLPLGWSGIRGMTGTIHIKHKTFRDTILQFLEGFIKAGFKKFFLSSAHHGNIHAYAMEEAGYKLMKKYKKQQVRIISPLNWIVKKLMIDDPKKTWGTMAETLGQPPLTEEEFKALAKDDHSSLMEVTFAKYINPKLVDPAYKEKGLKTTPISHMFLKLLSSKKGTLGGPEGWGYNGNPSMADSRDWLPLYKALIQEVGNEFVDALYNVNYNDFMDKYARSFFYSLVMLSTNWKWRAVYIPSIIIISFLCIFPLFPWNLLSLLYIPALFYFLYRKIAKVLNQK